MSAQTWARDRILIPRWTLLPEYALFVIMGVAAVVAGVPVLATVTGIGSFTWGVWTVLVGGLSIIGSFGPRFQVWEKIGTLGLMVSGAVLVAAAILAAASPFGVVFFVLVALLPTARFLSLTVRGEK